MSTARKNPTCLECGEPVGRWRRWCPECLLRRKAQQKAERRALALSGKWRCMDCGKPISAEHRHRCRACASRNETEMRLRKLAAERSAWWHDGPPPMGFAITEPGW